MSKIIGLTGGIATGKSTADAFFKKKDIPVVDADEIAHEIMEPGKDGYQAILAYFGPQILNADHTINRKVLGQIVFNDSNQLRKLNSLTHPIIKNEILAQMEALSLNHQLVILDIPLLFEDGYDQYCDQTIVISLPQEMQIKRLMERNNLTKEKALERINAQMPLQEKILKASFVVENTGTIDELEKRLEKVLIKIKQEE